MLPSLIILLDETSRLQRNALLQEYDGEITLTVINNISGLRKYRTELEHAIIIDAQFILNKASRYEQIKKIAPRSTIFVFSDQVDVQICRTAAGIQGSADKVMPPVVVRHILSDTASCGPGQILPQSAAHMRGNSPPMRDLYQNVFAVAPTNFNLILYGETGTGKEALARLIHDLSTRRDKPFVTLDCGSLNRETAISELFGHVRGAFTDAFSDKTGAFERASGGTLFLDELANLPGDIQIALLRAIQEKEIRKLGAVTGAKCDVRIIAATNEHLVQGNFRKDLYYRLNEMSLELPPLREREQDIIALAIFFLDNTVRELNTGTKNLADCARRKLMAYSWPGNVRELKNVIRRSCLMAGDQDTITGDMLQIEGYAMPETETPGYDALKDTVQRAEYDQILTALKSVQFNKRKAADLLNIHRKTLYNKLKYMKELFN